MNTLKIKPPVWFWVVSVLALLWNLIGVLNYLGQVYMPPEALEQMTQEQRLLFESQPSWVTGAFAIAVFSGTLGSIALLLRKKWARPILIASLLGIIAQQIHGFFISNALEVLGLQSLILPILVLIVGIGLVLFSNKAILHKWIG